MADRGEVFAAATQEEQMFAITGSCSSLGPTDLMLM